MKKSSPSRTYFRLLSYLLPLWKKVILLIVLTSIFALLSGISITLIPSFLHILFNEKPQTENVETLNAQEHSRLIPDSVEKYIDIAKQKAKRIIYKGTPTERLARFCVIFFSLMFIKCVFEYFSEYLNIYLGQSILKTIRDQLYGKIQKLPMAFFDRNKTGHLISRMTNDVTGLRGAIVDGISSIFRNGIMTIIAIGIIFYTSWKLSLVTMILVPINAFFIILISRKLRKGSIRAQGIMADMTMVLQETISGVRVVKAFGMGPFEKKKFSFFNLRYLKEYLKMRRFAELARPTSETLGMVASVIILWYGGKLVISEQLDPANLMMFIGAMLWVVNPIKRLSKINNMVQVGLGCAYRIFGILDIPTEEDSGGQIIVDQFRDKIEYKNVSFRYSNAVEVLKGINLEINKGEIIAIVGISGAGKSTLADLMARFYKITSGQILFDGKNIEDIKISSLRSMMGIVTQETILFNDTVYNNIAYGLKSCPRERIIEAAKAANAHDFISRMEYGYDTIIGDRGIQLSGGQRQRLAIARALLKNPQILILDEATSSLDVKSEALVQEAIDRLVRGRTALVIAHRLSTIRNADKIIVLDDGKIVQSGSHEELINEEGIYKNLHST